MFESETIAYSANSYTPHLHGPESTCLMAYLLINFIKSYFLIKAYLLTKGCGLKNTHT